MTRISEEIDLGGDVFILVGPDGSQTRIKVLSSLLALVSDYFRTLFGPRFKEGEESSHGKDITLKDDDPKAFSLLCKILHMRYVLPQQALKAGELLSLAVVADKYGCIEAMTLALPSIFPGRGPETAFDDCCRLTAAAYLFDHSLLFQQLTGDLLSMHANAITEAKTLSCATYLPQNAWFTLECKRSEARSTLTKHLTFDGVPMCDNANCKRMAEVCTKYTKQLLAEGVLPLDFDSKSISSLVAALQRTQPPGIRSFPSRCYDSTCISACQIILAFSHSGVVDTVQKQCEGLCIDCVRAGGISDRQCRIAHA